VPKAPPSPMAASKGGSLAVEIPIPVQSIAAQAQTNAALQTKRYCRLHNVRERRAKVKTRLQECKGCFMKIQTNCAEFALCPPCAEKDNRCMICGAGVHEPLYNVPSTVFPPLKEPWPTMMMADMRREVDAAVAASMRSSP
jgi:hypothetical protein